MATVADINVTSGNFGAGRPNRGAPNLNEALKDNGITDIGKMADRCRAVGAGTAAIRDQSRRGVVVDGMAVPEQREAPEA
ncbi:MAG: hypothetical protein WCT39_06235 [Candidatus Margulisiibacteriota bacterium]